MKEASDKAGDANVSPLLPLLPLPAESSASADDSAVALSGRQAVGKWDSWHPNQLWWLIALLALGAFGVFASGQFKEMMREMLPEAVPFPSSYNQHQSGYSALYDLCKKVGLQTERFEQPYRMLKEKKLRGTLVIVDPMETPSPQDAARISDWVAAGNDVVYFDYFNFGVGRTLVDNLEGSVRGPAAHITEETISKGADRAGSSAWSWVDKVVARYDTSLEGGTAIADGKAGSVLMKFKHGSGKCLIGTDTSFCSNEHIGDSEFHGNFQMIMNHLLQSKQPILFDEKCHGYSLSPNAVFFMLRRYTGYVIAQLLIIGLLAFVSCNQRFGQAAPVSMSRKISNLEFIDGLANTFMRARARSAAWAMVFQPLKT